MLTSLERIDRGKPVVSEAASTSWMNDRQRLLLLAAAGIAGLFVLGSFYTLYFAKAVFFPLILAVLLKLIFSPVVDRFGKWHVPNFVSAALVVGGIFGLCLAAILFLSEPAGRWIDDAPQHLRSVESKLQYVIKPITQFNQAESQVSEMADDKGASRPLQVEIKESGISASILNTTGGVVVQFFLTLVVLYFLLAGSGRLLQKLIGVTQREQETDDHRMIRLAHEIQHSISAYLFTMACINVVLGIVIGTGMWLVGLPNPVLWGVMAALLNFIPYFGAVLGGGIVFLVGLISLESASQAVWAPLIYYGANVTEGYFITPTILGRSISLSPLAIVVALIFWGWLWGVAGLLIAVPILAIAKIACDHTPQLRMIGQTLGR